MGKKNRNNTKKIKQVKRIEQRKYEVEQIYTKLASLGLTPEMNGIDKFFAITRNFVENGISCTGGIKLEGLKRTIVYILPMNPSVPASITLQYN
jgi:hypothetical protein